MASFDEVLKDCTKLGTKIPTSEYLENGKYPIIDQGQNDIAGYYDSDDGLFEDVPAIVFGDHTRVVKYVDKPCFLGADGVKLLCPVDKDINCKYLFYQLSYADIPNTGYNRHFKWVTALDFKIPSSDEQNHVVEVLDKVTALISLRKQQLAKLDDLVKARFANTFENDANFRTDYMENLSEFVTVGIANSATHAYAEHGVVMLRNQNIKENHLDDTELVYIEPNFADKYKSKKLESNDILVTRTGYPGIACIVPQKYAGSQTFTTLIIRLKKEANVSSCYICHYINSSHGKKYVSGTKVGVAQQNFGAKALAKMPVVVPPINLQNDFAAFVERVDQQKQRVQKSLEKLELMKKALIQEYFG